MSTYDVPGYNPVNHDELAMGCWAEHEDGSLILVENTEGNRVIYSMFDLTVDPIMEYRDAMPEAEFKKKFSWKSGESVESVKWLWKDKTPFDWDRVIKSGAKPGLRYVTAGDQISAARRVADALKLKARQLTSDDIEHFGEKRVKKVMKLAAKLQAAIDKLEV